MKILHLSTYDVTGGAARAAYRLHSGLRAAGHDSTMLVERHAKPADNQAPLRAEDRDRLREMLAPEYELIERVRREYAARLGLDVGAVFGAPALAGDERDH